VTERDKEPNKIAEFVDNKEVTKAEIENRDFQ